MAAPVPEAASEAHLALVRRLRLAYSGEYAAARAYGGHWRSVRDPEQRATIRRIQAEELEHRARIGEMLLELGSRPNRVRDVLMGWLGLAIAASCFVGGWYLPMVVAGRIERHNIREYEDAARRAVAAGRPEYVDEFLRMAEVEWDHERTFHDWARGHRLHGRLGDWPDPPPRDEIRASFQRDHPSLPVVGPTPAAVVAGGAVRSHNAL